jgi:Binding-protein-dependent transport system inner membrane component
MRVTRVSGFQRNALCFRAEHDPYTFGEIYVVGMRPFVIAPAHVDTNHARRHPGECVIKNLDVKCCALDEIRLREILKTRVPRHREIGAIDLKDEAGLGDGCIFLLHRGSDRLGVIHGIFPVAISTMNAVRNVAPVHRRTAKALRLSPPNTIMKVLAPAALPEILAGVRIGIAVTLFGILIAELFASSSGIGYALIRATEIHNVVDTFALTLLLFLFAVAINTLLQFSERRMRRHA